jgi:uncharacterized Zn-binding protein involved in type VI secretion
LTDSAVHPLIAVRGPFTMTHPAARRLRPALIPLSFMTIFAAVGSPAGAQTPGTEPAPPAAAPAATGSESTIVNGKPALRVGDTTADGQTVVQGSPDVFINGKPAAVVGGQTGCGNGVSVGSSNVFINGKPMALGGDAAGPCKK